MVVSVGFTIDGIRLPPPSLEFCLVFDQSVISVRHELEDRIAVAGDGDAAGVDGDDSLRMEVVSRPRFLLFLPCFLLSLDDSVGTTAIPFGQGLDNRLVDDPERSPYDWSWSKRVEKASI